MAIEAHAQDLIAAIEQQRNELHNTVAMLLAQDAAKSRTVQQQADEITALRLELDILKKAMAVAASAPAVQPTE